MPRKGENIYKRKDGRWEARYIYAFKEDGSPRYRSIYAADYLTVKKKQNDAKRKMDPRLFQSVRMKKNISFYGLLWLERLKPSSKESTYVRYHYLFSHYISPMIGDRLVYTFSNKDCEVFLNRLLVSGKRDGSGLAPKTVTDIRSVVKLILKTAEKEGELSLCNPELCPVKPVKKPLRILSLKEQQALYRWEGDISVLKKLKWLLVPRYRIVYLKRKCELHADKKHYIRFLFYRFFYQIHISIYSTEIGRRVKIGEGFIIRHLGAIAIHNDVVLGNNVELLNGVTIGYERRGKRQGAPTIGNNVWIGSNAVIVGKVEVGSDILIAPGAFVNFDVPDHSIVIGNPGVIIRKENATKGYMDNIDYGEVDV